MRGTGPKVSGQPCRAAQRRAATRANRCRPANVAGHRHSASQAFQRRLALTGDMDRLPGRVQGAHGGQGRRIHHRADRQCVGAASGLCTANWHGTQHDVSGFARRQLEGRRIGAIQAGQSQIGNGDVGERHAAGHNSDFIGHVVRLAVGRDRGAHAKVRAVGRDKFLATDAGRHDLGHRVVRSTHIREHARCDLGRTGHDYRVDDGVAVGDCDNCRSGSADGQRVRK